jgi:hypothetical protein
MKAGVEYTLHVDMQWSAPEVPKDFSVVAQGAAGGDIEITHWKGLTTKQLPVILRSGSDGDGPTPDPNTNGGGDVTPDPNTNGGGDVTPDPNTNGGGDVTPDPNGGDGGDVTPDPNGDGEIVDPNYDDEWWYSDEYADYYNEDYDYGIEDYDYGNEDYDYGNLEIDLSGGAPAEKFKKVDEDWDCC